MRTLDRNEWFLVQPARVTPRFTLLCFPYAGGGATIFHRWAEHLPPAVEVHAVRLPGRGTRLREPPITQMSELVDVVADLLEREPLGLYGCFGHSMGARIAFEVTRTLARRGSALPAHLWVSGSRAPQLARRRPPVHALADAELIAELRRYEGVPEQVLASPELLALHLPVVRTDLALHDTYAHLSGPPLPVPVSAFGGSDDPDVLAPDLAAWAEHTCAGFAVAQFPGGHFFLHHSKVALLERLSTDISVCMTAA